MGNDKLENTMNAIGAIADLAHIFYTGMIQAGASPLEASAGMAAFIQAFWTDSMNEARKKQEQAD